MHNLIFLCPHHEIWHVTFFPLNSLIQGVLQLHNEVHRASVCRSREVPSQSCGVPLNPMAHTGRGQQTTADMVSPLNIPSHFLFAIFFCLSA